MFRWTVVTILAITYIQYCYGQSYDECERFVLPFNKTICLLCDSLGWTKFPSTIIPEDIVCLSLKHNELTEVPVNLSSKNLTRFHLTSNKIKKLDKNVFSQMPKLMEVMIDDNNLEELHVDLFSHNPELRMLGAAKNKLTELSSTLFANNPSLLSVSFADNKIKSLPNGLFRSKFINGLDLQNNEIEHIGDDAFVVFDKLRVLKLHSNKIKKLPADFANKIPTCVELYLQNNSLNEFPWEPFWKREKKMSLLNVAYNNISYIPEAFAKNAMLRWFDFAFNPIHCDCKMDWLRKRYWIEFKHAGEVYMKELQNAFFRIGNVDNVSCASPELYAGQWPTAFTTFCDVDECLDKKACKAGDLAVCKNTPGDFECTCRPGFFGYGKHECKDIDECMVMGGAMMDCDLTKSHCKNTFGSYNCPCLDGYIHTDSKQRNCSDINECEGEHGCPVGATCINTKGSFRCECPGGHEVKNHKCVDIDECAGDHGCEKACYNNIGSFLCNCRAGYYYGADKECHDVNECDVNEHECHEFATCINNEGSYNCKCMKGFVGDGRTCKDVDECLYSTDNCHGNATCANTIGSFKCTCHEGLFGDGVMFCGTKTMHQKFLQTIAAQKTAMLTGSSDSSVTIIVIVVVLLILIGGAIGAIFYFRPSFIFNRRQRYDAVSRLDDTSTMPLTSDDKEEDE